MSSERIRGSIEGVAAYLEAHPGDAVSTDPPAVAVRDGELRFRASGPSGQEVVTDMARAVGGDGSAPSPGWLLRAALATCDATLIAMEAARRGIELTTLEVSVDSDSDDRGLFGIDGIAPGPLVVRTRIRLGAEGVEEGALREVLAAAEANSPVADAIRRAMDTRTEVELV
ncbi:MAG TPA: OsmC family protein [Candidatus Limnocylindrales bacterium]|nr:OsmC family protein [Candidatus Limnocylindrales bacterium]